ncbi:MAG: lysophospholipid acyltransferase family protein [Chloroflexota bacterium]|nr:lysophospholipid acyltransferase family protein [Chloroflexota bacterium]
MEYLADMEDYRSPDRDVSWIARKFATTGFYAQLLPHLWKISGAAKRGDYNRERWVHDSIIVVKGLESVGVYLEIENAAAFQNMESPCVFASNHMSTMETFIFPGIIAPFREIVFIVKESLIKLPVFKHIMLSSNPIVVGRNNPREDFEVVLRDGQEHLKRNVSVIIFPQGSRSDDFDPKEFNTLGTKLARRAGVPVIPVALKTDAWGNNGLLVKDFGRIYPAKPVRICFGDPVYIEGKGRKEHESIVQFIAGKLQSWR